MPPKAANGRRRLLAKRRHKVDARSGNPLDVQISDAFNSYIARAYLKEKGNSEGRGEEFVSLFSQQVKRGMVPARVFQECLFHIMNNNSSHSSPDLSCKAASAYEYFLKKHPPCGYCKTKGIALGSDGHDENYWSPLDPHDMPFVGKVKAGDDIEIVNLAGFRLALYWLEKVVNVLKYGRGPKDLGSILTFKSLTLLLEGDLLPRLDVVRSKENEVLEEEKESLIKNSILWRLMEGASWASDKAEFIRMLILGVAVEHGIPVDPNRGNNRGVLRTLPMLLPQEITKYIQRTINMLLEIFGFAEEQGWYMANSTGLRYSGMDNDIRKMDELMLLTTFNRIAPEIFKLSFKNKAAFLASLPGKHRMRMMAVMLAKYSHDKGNATEYLDSVYQYESNPNEVFGPFQLDPLDLIYFLNDDSTFKWACGLDALKEDGIALWVDAITTATLWMEEFNPRLGELMIALSSLISKLEKTRMSGEAHLKLEMTKSLLKLKARTS